MAFESIRYEVDAGVGVLTLNRPDSLNSFTEAMHLEVRDALTRARADTAVRCILITGAGRGFCAGQDLAEVSEVNPRQDEDAPSDASHGGPNLGDLVETHYNPLIRAIMTLPKPVVCAVNGIAAGAGASVALACDIVIAARSAAFAQVFCKIGLVPDSGGTFNLPRAIGLPRAKGLAMLGDKLSAEKAEAWGMIWQCVDDDELMPEARKLARHLATQPTRGLALTKQLLNASMSTSLHEQLESERYAMSALGESHDFREGVAAFLAKRAPAFKGA